MHLLKTLRVVTLLVVAACLAGCVSSTPQVMQSGGGYGGRLMLGIDVLAGNNYNILRGKRVGLITNHTSYTTGASLQALSA